MWDVDNFSVLTENVETKDFSKWQAIKRIYLSELLSFTKELLFYQKHDNISSANPYTLDN